MEFNPHAHLENPELAREQKALDEGYNDPLNISLGEQKEQLRNSLYCKNQSSKEDQIKDPLVDSEEVSECFEVPENIQNIPEFNIIK